MNQNKRKMMNLINQRNEHIQHAQQALDSGDQTTYEAEMNVATGMNAEIDQLMNLIQETERYDVKPSGDAHAAEDAIKEKADALRKGNRVAIPQDRVLSTIREAVNSVLIGTDSLAKPTGAGVEVRDNHASVSAILGMVDVEDLSGCSEWMEPYVKTVSTAGAGTDGSAPTTSEPVFRVAAIKPALVNTVAYVSRHIAALTPTRYYEKVEQLALDALRRKVVAYMTNGDGSTFYGFTNATNTKSEAIYDTMEVSSATIGATFLRDLVLGSGGDDTIGNGVLQLNKADLVAIGDVRGTNEKKAVFEIIPDAATNGNTGVIKDGGLSVPYVINSNLTALSTSSQGASAIKTMVYGDPYAYMLGLFSDYTVEVDSSYKFAERLWTILGEVMAGGNLCVHEGMTVVTLAATSVGG